MSENTIVVNNHYPISYFANANIAQVFSESDKFWASDEKFAPEEDSLIFDLLAKRPINFVDFQICQKPIDIIVEYDNNSDPDTPTWTPVIPDDRFQLIDSVTYLPSLSNPWYYLEYHFSLVETRYIRLTFVRRNDPFPFPNSEQFRFSVEVRNLRLMHLVSSVTDFVTDTGQDILGNTIRTSLKFYSANAVIQ